MLVYIDIDY